jgi:hypothetical protein
MGHACKHQVERTTKGRRKYTHGGVHWSAIGKTGSRTRAAAFRSGGARPPAATAPDKVTCRAGEA